MPSFSLLRVLGAFCVVIVFFFGRHPALAEQFDDITVVAQPFHQGQTFHGYCEFRIVVENLSPRTTHRVTLVCPNRPWSSGGNSISRLSRTVTLAPNASAVVSLWQPPLPLTGDGSLRVEVDGANIGQLPLPNANGHGADSSRYGSAAQSTVLVSRNLDHSDIERAFQGSKFTFTAAMATGAPDSRRGVSPQGWMPDPGSGMAAHWLELDYEPPVAAQRVRVHDTIGTSRGCEMVLIGVSGTNLLKMPLPSVPRSSGSSPREVTFPLTSEPVKTVRLEFSMSPPHSINIDAVELEGSSGSVWAADARASSDASSMSASYGSSRSGGASRFCLRAEFPVSQWSEHWLSYSAYDTVVLTSSDISAMPASVADALWRYVECGGNLVILGRTRVPVPWSSKVETIENCSKYSVGFGRCFVLEGQKMSQAPSAVLSSLQRAADDSAHYWSALPRDEAANSTFRVVDSLSIPVRGMVFIMLAFVLLIGPVNIIFLSRIQRRTWMLWTIPAISVATCLFVFAYSFLSEGITPSIRIEGISLLDQVNKRATTLGLQAFYCPLTPGQGLKFGAETEATPLVESGWNQSSGNMRDVDWTQAQHFRNGWVNARVPAHFVIRKSETRRERLQLEMENGKLTVVNGLGAPIRSLWLRDARGNAYKAADISAGGKAELAVASPIVKPSGNYSLNDIIHKTSFGGQISFLTKNVETYLDPGTYIVELDENPFLENGLGPNASKRKRTTAGVVYGILDAAGISAESGRAAQ
jgi:hypothetical protein